MGFCLSEVSHLPKLLLQPLVSETPASKGSKHNSILLRFGILVGDENTFSGFGDNVLVAVVHER